MSAAVPSAPTIVVRDVPASGTHCEGHADEAFRQSLAERAGLPEITELSYDLAIRPWRKTGAIVKGTVAAVVVQDCVVTLEPFSSDVRIDVRETFLPASEQTRQETEEILVDAEDPDDPEFFVGGAIDLNDLLLQLLVLSLDPYPRAPGAAVPDTAADDARAPDEELDVREQNSPFAMLKVLRDGQ